MNVANFYTIFVLNLSPTIPMPPISCSQFYPVGQGTFHSGMICSWPHNPKFTLVYDCGSVSTGSKKLLKRSVKSFTENLDCCYSAQQSKQIDLLCISHFDKDHINGIPELLDQVDSIKCIAFPYLTPEMRLYSILKLIAEYGNEEDILVEDFNFLKDAIKIIFKTEEYFDDKVLEAIIEVESGDFSDQNLVSTPPDNEDEQNVILESMGYKLIYNTSKNTLDNSLSVISVKPKKFRFKDSVCDLFLIPANTQHNCDAYYHFAFFNYRDDVIEKKLIKIINNLVKRLLLKFI